MKKFDSFGITTLKEKRQPNGSLQNTTNEFPLKFYTFFPAIFNFQGIYCGVNDFFFFLKFW
jgi:hypothetical protein